MTHSLSTKGLSMSQAQSISNLCNQKVKLLDSKLYNVNNVKKVFSYNGEEYTLQEGLPLPNDIVKMLEEKSSLYALQAFLMENIKAKESLLKEVKTEICIYPEPPQKPVYENVAIEFVVDENWGWKQLTKNEYNDYLINESHASHIGQYIHNNGILDNLRKTFTKDLNFQTVELQKDVKVPLRIIPNHSEDKLFTLHQELANLHRKYEQKVNYYKAKVKNLVSDENARIARDNAKKISEVNSFNEKLGEEYSKLWKEYSDNKVKLSQEFEEKRMGKIKEISAYRIEIPSDLQSLVDEFVKDIKEVG